MHQMPEIELTVEQEEEAASIKDLLLAKARVTALHGAVDGQQGQSPTLR